jgi:hypothetical protein
VALYALAFIVAMLLQGLLWTYVTRPERRQLLSEPVSDEVRHSFTRKIGGTLLVFGAGEQPRVEAGLGREGVTSRSPIGGGHPRVDVVFEPVERVPLPLLPGARLGHRRHRAGCQPDWSRPMGLPSGSLTDATSLPPPTSLTACWTSAPASTSCWRLSLMSSTCQ